MRNDITKRRGLHLITVYREDDMLNETHQKVMADHLKRNAYLYIRQSTPRQVFENTESTERQYALRRRAAALGWHEEEVIVIDNDQGQSGDSAADREGFQKLVSEVGMGKAGIVMGLEVSRLARSSTDWHRLLEICALTETLILDEDGIYNPGDFNDRLLLGLKGTMSEAELHILRMRLQGGLLNKAERGELRLQLPDGLVYDADDRVILDPDKQVRECLQLLFDTFRRTGSAMATVKYFREQKIRFPRRPRSGPHKGELIWGDLTYERALQVLHNPRYAGAFAYGKVKTVRKTDGGSRRIKLPMDQWQILIPDAHPGYISWQTFEENQKRLRENDGAYGNDCRNGPPREGPALLQGLAVCGVCGSRMTVRYHNTTNGIAPEYVCIRALKTLDRNRCQIIPGRNLDEEVGRLLVEAVNPLTLEVSLSVQEELQRRIEETDRLRYKQVERARYEAELARRRYMMVDPDNRLVADSLESDWNDKLRTLADAQEEYDSGCRSDRLLIEEEQRARILEIATDFPRLWQNPKTSNRERKRMVRLMIEDVTLIKDSEITAHVRFRGGADRTLTLPIPKNAWQQRKTSDAVIAEIDILTNHYTDEKIVDILNKKGLRSGTGKPFTPDRVKRIRRAYGLKNRYDRLRESGMLTHREIADRLGVHRSTVQIWAKNGLLLSHAFNDCNQCLYEDPGDNPPVKSQGRRLSERRRFPQVVSDHVNEVQYET